MGLLVILLVGALALLPVPAAAQVFTWRDAHGIVYYTNAPERLQAHRARAAVQEDPAPAPAAEEPVVSVGMARIPFTPGAPILVRARLGGGESIVLMLDTGADRTMVTPEVLARLGISTRGAQQVEIRGVTGVAYGAVVSVPTVEVGEARVGPLRIIAHDSDLRRADGLLGRDFLDHFTVTIDAREGIVTLTPR